MSLSNVYEIGVLNHILRRAPLAQPSGLFLALFTSPTSDASPGTEVAGNGYARQAITFGDAVTNAEGEGETVNTNNPQFTASGGDWGIITYAAIMDASSGGNMVSHGILTVDKQIDDTDTIVFEAGKVKLTLD